MQCCIWNITPFTKQSGIYFNIRCSNNVLCEHSNWWLWNHCHKAFGQKILHHKMILSLALFLQPLCEHKQHLQYLYVIKLSGYCSQGIWVSWVHNGLHLSSSNQWRESCHIFYFYPLTLPLHQPSFSSLHLTACSCTHPYSLSMLQIFPPQNLQPIKFPFCPHYLYQSLPLVPHISQCSLIPFLASYITCILTLSCPVTVSYLVCSPWVTGAAIFIKSCPSGNTTGY